MSAPDPKVIRADYETTLAELVVNSKALINTLTILAEENIQVAAPEIVEAIEQKIVKADVDKKLPLFYLMDSILKNVGGTYIRLFSRNLVLVFHDAFTLVDEKTQGQLIRLRSTWNALFPHDVLQELDRRIALHQQQKPRRPSDTIHVNPEFVRKEQERAAAAARPPFDPRNPHAHQPPHHRAHMQQRPPGAVPTDPRYARQPVPGRPAEYGRSPLLGVAPTDPRNAPGYAGGRESPRPGDPHYQAGFHSNRPGSPYAGTTGPQRTTSNQHIRGPPSPTPPGPQRPTMQRVPSATYGVHASASPKMGSAEDMTGGMSAEKRRELLDSQRLLLKQAHDQLSSGMLTSDQHKILCEQLSQLFVIQQMQQQNKLQQGVVPGNLLHFVPLPPGTSPVPGGPPIPTPPQPQVAPAPVPAPAPTFLPVGGGVVPAPGYGVAPAPSLMAQYLAQQQGMMPGMNHAHMMVPGQQMGIPMPLLAQPAVPLPTAAPAQAVASPIPSAPAPASGAPAGGAPGGTSSTGAPLNASQLFNQLVNLGLIKPKPQAPAPAPAPTQVPESRKPKFRQTDPIVEEQAVPTITLDTQGLNTRHESVIRTLYQAMPLQCQQCGLRFGRDGSEAMTEHMDWHFRTNRRDKEKLKKASSRRWYVAQEDWINDKEVDTAEERAPAFFEASGAEEKEEPSEPEVSCPVDMKGAPGEDTCTICGEKFDKFWNEEAEAWHYRAAVRVDEETYHQLCYREAEKNGELASGALTPRKLSEAGPENAAKRKASTDSENTADVKKLKQEPEA